MSASSTDPFSRDQAFPVPDSFAKSALIDRASYLESYHRSIEDPEGFWREHGRRIDWIRPYTKIRDVSYDAADLRIRWFHDGILNACGNCVDRHLETRADQAAILWEGDEPDQDRALTYRELHRQVCRFANGLKEAGARKGDRITIYMPMIPEAVVAMLACARIGAVHSVVFGGFSPEALADRVRDAGSDMLITADEGVRGGKRIPLKANVDRAVERCPAVRRVIVARHTGADIPWNQSRDIWSHDLAARVENDCPLEEMAAEDPLFILYTSGSTGKPKGILHTTGGYLVYASMTHQYAFDCQDGDVHWCTADIGWVTGHSYLVYGPLANGATTLMFEGVPNYPDASRFWRICDKHGVSLFYTAPTAIRALMREGEGPVRATSRKTLRVLGTVGEPINPEAWRFYHQVVGDGRCPVVDTWWQTETGGIMIAPLPGATDLKPGSATRPFFGIRPILMNARGEEVEGAGEGDLCIADSWPGQMRAIHGDRQRFVDTYFTAYPGRYFTGDGARRDEDGDYWITGRVDDVINVSGHRMGTAEVESALVAHPLVAEAAVVGFPHEIKGQGVYAYVTLMAGQDPDEDLRAALRVWVGERIGPIARPDFVQWAPGLPKTRSGKIMRRILRKIAADDPTDLGDTSTLADPAVVDDLIESRRNRAAA